MGKMQVINPATEEIEKEFDTHTPEEVEHILDEVAIAWEGWRQTSFAQRAKYMNTASELLEARADEYAMTMAHEMGKPLSGGVGEINKCAWVCRYYAENAEELLKDDILQTEASKTMVAYQPIGTILSIMPWNFPFWQVFRQIAPNLMAGNTLVLKHASNVPESALAIEQLMKDAGFPENVFRTLLVPGNETEAIILNPHIKGVTLTGSTPAGKKVAASAGSVLKKLVLELGGSDPYIILEDADVAQAATACVTSRLINTGQSCIAAKRFIVVESIFDAFVEKFVDAMSKATMGDPTTDVTIGPMARVDLRDELHQQVVDSVTAGAEIAVGGTKPEGRGAFYPVTVLTNVKKGMPAYDEELFGPVASVIKVKDEEEAIRVANDSIFGLGGAVFTRDLAKGERIAKEEIQAGAVFVNNFVISDPRVPFGGIKESGYGRELGSLGIKEFTNPKTVQIV